ncbi:hypothetical protein VSDG_05590 [Cytospora chrysosperma]|uniref:ribonuclease H n=1 Tax=Cytospora chrysosperma TaxID=252740 RepID=A0A423W0B1_CYTCH|nr:hypothetical protein VSDG_05590 [Valsa sordida]
MDDEMLEVEGFSGHMHVRCHASSSRACRCGRYILHTDSMIVAVDGACPSNGTGQAVKSACGVYLGPGADNWSWRVADTPGERHTSSRAELHAAIGALKAVMPFTRNGGQMECEHPGGPCIARHVVIKSDSAYLVDSVTQHISKWDANGWKTSKKTPVKNRDLWEDLMVWLYLVESESETRVHFWHVPRGENVEADRLANEGLQSRRVLGICALEPCDVMESEERLYPYT